MSELGDFESVWELGSDPPGPGTAAGDRAGTAGDGAAEGTATGDGTVAGDGAGAAGDADAAGAGGDTDADARCRDHGDGAAAGTGPPEAEGHRPLERGDELGLEHRAVEAVLLCAVEPVPVGLLAELLELPPARVAQVCDELAADYRAQRRGFGLVEVAGGFRYQTDPDLAPFVERFAMEGVSTRLSSAALETLAIIAYKQPVSRAQVAALRGVNVDGVVRLLNQRGLVTEVGHAPGPGQPVLYGTTPAFLEKLGLNTLDQLPAVEDLFPGPEVVEVLEARLRPDAEPA